MASGKPAVKAPKKHGRPFFESGRLILYTVVAAVTVALVVLLGLRLSVVQTMLCHVAFVSTITFGVFAIDKLRAKRDVRRVSEFNLMMLSAIGGAVGGMLAMTFLRHKSQRPHFAFGLPTIAFVHGVIIMVAVMN